MTVTPQPTPSHEADVLVVGAGPTGLTAAGDLARAGRSVAVLERWPGMNPVSRAFATMARTLEVLDARGLADDLLAQSHRAPSVAIFAGARIDLTHLRSRYPFVAVTPQTNVDQAVARYAEAQGAAIHRGIEVVALEQDADGVTVTARPKGDDDPDHRSTWRAQYVIGADGSHSTVRRLLGVDFPGRTMLSSVMLADVQLDRGPADGGLTLGSDRDRFAFLAPYGREDAGGAWYRTMAWDRHHQVPDTEPVTPAEVTAVLDRAMGRDVGVRDVGWLSRFHCDERQVRQYRHGRVLLAGDAAHVHSPMGGQGMNTGIQDAANLAWKIDAVLGGAPDDVLDSYHRERHPIGRRVLFQSGLMARGVTLHPRVARLLRNLLVPWALRRSRVRDAVAGSFAGTTLRYPRRPGDHALVGTRATEIPLVDDNVMNVLREGRFVLVRERGGEPVGAPSRVAEAERADHGPAVLVRPDGYIAWAGATVQDDGWFAALTSWTGPVQVTEASVG
ncbi:FAD-dependent oxidoreductase [Aeromicrobium chenweiae]|uniref:FAD-dependent oxidoreductase n=1 Tax=Aeromicrobium chenweiae TaxID=2079793 RepID=A0A2S0WJ91_9ACTN|nr:FAD-dependent oxidoreductase [Aeromicrobium chenweiae]AWB91406.1 FAD-dependent oxidoreductase [Aeromicrobium chenweiae]TGN30663.1 FAD-binding protein [Aeromicrobium chenweiae]